MIDPRQARHRRDGSRSELRASSCPEDNLAASSPALPRSSCSNTPYMAEERHMNEAERRVARSRRGADTASISRAEALAEGMSLRTVQRRASDGDVGRAVPARLPTRQELRGPGGSGRWRRRSGPAKRLGGLPHDRGDVCSASTDVASRRSASHGAEAMRSADEPRRRSTVSIRSPGSIDRPSSTEFRCTSATRTIIDCAAFLDEEALEVAFESARRMGLTSPRALAQRAEALCGRGRPGSASVRKLARRAATR